MTTTPAPSRYRSRLRRACEALGFAFDSGRQAEALDEEHPFSRALDRLRVLLRQSLSTAAALIAIGSGAALGARWGRLLLVPAVVVQGSVLVGVALAAAIACARADELIADGRGDLQLPVLAWRRRQLAKPRRRETLARAFESRVEIARRWHRTCRNYRPVWNVLLVRQVEPELLEIAALLRTGPVDPRGVVLAHRLLTQGCSPLYGREIDELRRHLRRVREALTAVGR